MCVESDWKVENGLVAPSGGLALTLALTLSIADSENLNGLAITESLTGSKTNKTEPKLKWNQIYIRWLSLFSFLYPRLTEIYRTEPFIFIYCSRFYTIISCIYTSILFHILIFPFYVFMFLFHVFMHQFHICILSFINISK